MSPLEGFGLEEIVRFIAEEPAPVLFVDTCALLDVIRLPVRLPGERGGRGAGERAGRNASAAAMVLAGAGAEPRGLWLVVPPPVVTEFERNLPKVLFTLDAHWRSLDREYEKTPHVGSALEVGVPAPPSFEVGTGELRERLVTIARRLTRAGLHLSPEDRLKLKALTRAELGHAPGRRGTVSVADCTVVEHVQAVADGLGTHFPCPKVLITSNLDDFYEYGSRPKPPLDEEFARCGIQLVKDWEWAASALSA